MRSQPTLDLWKASGSYPAFRNGKPSVSLVLRGTDDARLAVAAAELMATIRDMNGEAEEFVI